MRIIAHILLLLAASVWAAEPAPSARSIVRVWQSQDGLPGNVVRSIVQAGDGYLWVATAEGLARFDGLDFELIEPEDGELRRAQLSFSRLFTGRGGRVWAATYQGGLFRSGDGRLIRILDNQKGPQPPVVTQLIEIADGSAYVMRGGEIRRVLPSGAIHQVTVTPELRRRFDMDIQSRLHGGRVRDAAGNLLLRDRLGRLWISGQTGGLSVAENGEPPQPVELPQIGRGYGINEMFEDSEGNVWLACQVNGLVRVRQARVEMLVINHEENERAVSALMQDHAGFWWIADRRGGITRWSSDEARFLDLTRSRQERPAAALFEDRDCRLWVASRDGTVFRLNGETLVFHPQFTKTQVPSKVRSITQDSHGLMWFGGSQGLASFDGETVHPFGKSDGVEGHDITVVRNFPDGRIIAGSSAGAVLLGDARGFETIATPETLKRHWVSGILPVSHGETWVSTLGGGLYFWNGGKWFNFDVNSGLPDPRLTCVVDDGKGHLWMGSLSGIIRVERENLLARVRTPQTHVRWMRLDHTDGLLSRECIGGFQPAVWRAMDGQLWFPTGSGVARVRPELVSPNEVRPPVYLRKVRANGNQHPVGTGPVLANPGRARLEFHFVGLSLSAPEKVTYRARLAGLDDSWRELGNQRLASFEAVPPGEYTFEVMAVNGDGLRSVVPARIPIIIKPHFWETPWFFVSVGGFILAIAVAIGWTAARMRMKDRIMALKVRSAREGERSRIARDLHDDLGASLTEISILAALAAEDAAEGPLGNPLHQLSVKAKHAVGNLDEIVWAVNPRQDTLRSLVDYIAAFAREFLDLAGISLRLDVAREIPEHPLPAARRHGIFLTVREVLNNIVKHSGAREVFLGIALADQLLEIRIQDNGRGFDPEYAAGGDGLMNLTQRMREVGGDCRIESHRGQGTVVFLTLPLNGSDKAVS